MLGPGEGGAQQEARELGLGRARCHPPNQHRRPELVSTSVHTGWQRQWASVLAIAHSLDTCIFLVLEVLPPARK